jgi:23S rRNA (pseudouridine1915-N3)-methyltransferase
LGLSHYFLREIFNQNRWRKEAGILAVNIKVLWPGKTKVPELRHLQESYLKKIGTIARLELIETKEARGLKEDLAEKIKEIEARGLEKHLKDDYIVCLFDEGKEMTSADFARFLEKHTASSSRSLAFIVGGHLGLAARLLKRANLLLSLSRMTFSHDLCRVILLEQIFRSLTILKGLHYAK